MKKTYDTDRAAAAQRDYCAFKHLPLFAPGSYNGYACGNCYRNIYGKDGVSVEEAGNKHITGCPFCHHSFCE